MFTKYNDITLPQNYSGNRFRAFPSDTEMKTHKAADTAPLFSSIKTSVSPTFQNSIGSAKVESLDENPKELEFSVQDESEEKNLLQNDEEAYTHSAETKKSDNNSFLDLIAQSGFGKLFGSARQDDVLLLVLILLLAEEESRQNSDAILILALLLLYR